MQRSILSLIVIMLFAGACTTAASGVQHISTEDAASLVQQPATFLLDVRTPGEHAQGHIQGTDGLADWTTWQSSFSNLNEKPSKDQPIVVYCQSGGRSARAADWLQQQGYTKVYNMEGGYTRWRAEKRS